MKGGRLVGYRARGCSSDVRSGHGPVVGCRVDVCFWATGRPVEFARHGDRLNIPASEGHASQTYVCTQSTRLGWQSIKQYPFFGA